MKNILTLLLSIILLSSCSEPNSSMTFNLRYSTDNDKENSWNNRKEDLVQLLNKHKPDIIGTQEGLISQIEYIDNELSYYSYAGVARDDGKEKGEFAAIFYNNQKFDLVESKTFWLSETPEKISVGWDAAMERICTYVKLKNKVNNTEIHVFNAHFDHIGDDARMNSALLIKHKMEEMMLGNAKVLVMGDFNCSDDSQGIKTFNSYLDDPLKTVKLQGPKGTWNAFDTSVLPENRIDYIFTSGTEAIEYIHLD